MGRRVWMAKRGQGYGEQLESNLERLIGRIKANNYRAPGVAHLFFGLINHFFYLEALP